MLVSVVSVGVVSVYVYKFISLVSLVSLVSFVNLVSSPIRPEPKGVLSIVDGRLLWPAPANQGYNETLRSLPAILHMEPIN